ncbi:MAG: glycosyltransferase, partial [Lysobacterales bacterium]
DVVLLNSDTVTTPGWLDALARCAGSDPLIATATPWSNNAEICSMPEFCRANPVPIDIDRVGVAVAAAASRNYPELPTGVGFCMFIRRTALDAVGSFDAATFGRGYGEENDFCRRAARHGWRNVLCDDAYVAHIGHASFAGESLAPGGLNQARLEARYPDYSRLVSEFIAGDSLAPLRARIAQRLGATTTQRCEAA